VRSLTEILKVDPLDPDIRVVEEIAGVVRAGGVIGYPTETVYGIGCDPFNRDAVGRIYDIKQRPQSMPLLLLISGRGMLRGLVSEIPPVAEDLMRDFWPGPLTIVFRSSGRIPPPVSSDRGTVALRDSGLPFISELIGRLGFPLVSTSANLSGSPPARSAGEVMSLFGGRLDLVVDGGKSPSAEPSTVVDVSDGKVKVLREGCIKL